MSCLSCRANVICWQIVWGILRIQMMSEIVVSSLVWNAKINFLFLECQNKFLVQEVKTLNLKLECLEKEVKAANAMNTQAKIISSPKTTHVNNNTRVINNLVVDDSDQISIVSPVNEANKEVNYSLVNGPHQINIDHNTCNRNQ